ncbi:MAG: laccase domain-containing protein, partial [Gemmatimonadota bacterium]|nr:laccase domain-containing protein [Gemmatimonadota bacterium]
PPPSSPSPIDLRAAIAARAARLGILPERITLSAHCTRCGEGEFFSHRGGSEARQMGVLGVVAAGA